jgi:subfamily B ATP-binding cassette protein MsbA
LNDSGRGSAPAGTPDPMPATRVYRRLLRYAWPYRGTYLIGLFGMLLYAATDVLTLFVMRGFLGAASGQAGKPLHVPRFLGWATHWLTELDHFMQSTQWFTWLPYAVLLIFLCRGTGDYLAQYFPARVARQVVKVIRAELFARYLRLPTSRYDADSSARMLNRLTYNTEMMAGATANSLTSLIRDSLQTVGNIGYLFFVDWYLALVSLLVAPAIAVLAGSINRRFRRYSQRIQNSMGDVTRVAKEAFDAHRVVKVFNAQKHIERLFEVANEQNRRSNVRLLQAQSSSNPIVQQIAAIGLGLVLFVANRQLASGVLDFAAFGTFVIALMQVTQPLKRLLAMAGPLQQGIAAGADVFAVLDAAGEPQGGTRTLTRVKGEVEFRNVSFEYAIDKGKVLHNINVRVAAGTTLAIVGRSGSGKSTLVSLLPRFYDPTAGSVRIDGEDIRDYRLTDLRNQISLVSQEVVIFNDTLRNNIVFGAEGISDQQLQAAVRAAYVHEFVEQLPQGLETMAGDRGVTLSGGQRQRIAIARALLRDTPILILDEATSSLDTAAERHIQDALDQLVKNRTTLVIAHRLSTIEHADSIVVMREGSVVECGPHAELIERGGAYAELHRLQFSA